MKENWELAFDDYKQGMKYKEIANKYGVSLNTVKSWKTRYWNKKGVHTKSKKVCTQKKNKGGAPKGNKNSNGAPLKNKRAEKHGFFSKWLPEETLEIIQETNESNPIDILWDNIQFQYAAIIRAQKLMYVKEQKDITKEVSLNGATTAYDIQYAWDKHATFMSAQSRAMKTLESMIKQYDELIHKNWETVTEEQRARIENIKAQTRKLETVNDDTDDDKVVIINDLPRSKIE